MAVKTSESWEKTGGPAVGTSFADDSEEKLQYAFRIILESHRGKTMTSENEIRSLRQTIEELKSANSSLTKKFAVAEREIMEQQHRNQVLAKDNENLTSANRQLLQRVEKYKRIQQTFSEALENSSHEEEPLPMSFNSEYRSAAAPFTLAPAPIGHMSPKTVPVEARVVVEAPRPAPPAASTGFDSNGKDGKQFFRIVRSRMQFESFNAFLSIIKKLNSHEFTREVAAEEAKRIFGVENADLIGDFQALISRHAPSTN